MVFKIENWADQNRILKKDDKQIWFQVTNLEILVFSGGRERTGHKEKVLHGRTDEIKQWKNDNILSVNGKFSEMKCTDC